MRRVKKAVKKDYFDLIKLSIKPQIYSLSYPEGTIRQAMLFFLINFCLGSLIRVILESLLTQNITLFFLGISGTVFFIPIALLILFLIAGALHLLAKLLSGKGSFKDSLRATSYSMIYLILFWIPFVGVAAYLLMLYCLTMSFSKDHQYSKIRAIVNVAIPFLLTMILSVILGLINSNRPLTS